MLQFVISISADHDLQIYRENGNFCTTGSSTTVCGNVHFLPLFGTILRILPN